MTAVSSNHCLFLTLKLKRQLSNILTPIFPSDISPLTLLKSAVLVLPGYHGGLLLTDKRNLVGVI